jgi:hypothetical protein
VRNASRRSECPQQIIAVAEVQQSRGPRIHAVRGVLLSEELGDVLVADHVAREVPPHPAARAGTCTHPQGAAARGSQARQAPSADARQRRPDRGRVHDRRSWGPFFHPSPPFNASFWPRASRRRLGAGWCERRSKAPDTAGARALQQPRAGWQPWRRRTGRPHIGYERVVGSAGRPVQKTGYELRWSLRAGGSGRRLSSM